MLCTAHLWGLVTVGPCVPDYPVSPFIVKSSDRLSPTCICSVTLFTFYRQWWSVTPHHQPPSPTVTNNIPPTRPLVSLLRFFTFKVCSEVSAVKSISLHIFITQRRHNNEGNQSRRKLKAIDYVQGNNDWLLKATACRVFCFTKLHVVVVSLLPQHSCPVISEPAVQNVLKQNISI